MTNDTIKQESMKAADNPGPRDELVDRMARSDAAAFIHGAFADAKDTGATPEERRMFPFFDETDPLEDMEIDTDQDTLVYKGVTIENTQEGMRLLYMAIRARTGYYVGAFKERAVRSYQSGRDLAAFFTPVEFERFIRALGEEDFLRMLINKYRGADGETP